MFYKPKHCVECGAKIERDEWKLWTSRRFCEDCEDEHASLVRRVMPPIIAASMLLFSGLTLGYFSAQTANNRQPVIVRNNQPPAVIATANPAAVAPIGKNVQPVPPPTAAPQAATPTARQPKTLTAPISPVDTTAPNDGATYYCGARTQKGSPCSRKVKNGGRCFQHQGKPAMMPQEKLLVQAAN